MTETTLPVAHVDDIPAVAAMMREYALPIEEVLARMPARPERRA
jgi:molybdopterin-guanine dinucleotide biosynthesis protein B